MNKDIVVGFLCASCMFLTMGLVQVRNEYSNSSDVKTEFNNLFSGVQPKQFSVVTSTPSFQDIKQGEIFIVNSNGVVNLVTRIGNTIKALTRN